MAERRLWAFRTQIQVAHSTQGGRTKPLARQWRLWLVVRADIHRAHFVI